MVKYKEKLNEIGFLFEVESEDVIVVKSVPHILREFSLGAVEILKYVTQLRKANGQVSKPKVIHKVLASVACKGDV